MTGYQGEATIFFYFNNQRKNSHSDSDSDSYNRYFTLSFKKW